MAKIRLALAIHNHQPIGNFDGVFEQSFRDSYLPFLEVLDKYGDIPFALHTSGSLLEWLVDHEPTYVEQLRRMVDRGQVEILGGGFYEPILPSIPSRDRQGQIRGYTEYLKELFNTPIRGMWVPERVWEQSLVSDIVLAGIEYSILDDYHFRKAGLRPDQLHGYFLSEDEGHILRIFPGSEPMRYIIPFQDVENAIGYLRDVANRFEDALVVFADDGEKFGAWPETYKHCYQDGWLYRFLDALRANRDWIELVTPSQAMDQQEPLGSVYLPDCSYREMTEWALPAERLTEYERLTSELQKHPEAEPLRDYLKAGFWRNFKMKYPETNEMYSRMMQVSTKLDQLCAADPTAVGDHRLHLARQALYRGQCNCSYWHGAFGGLYLPHLRNAIYTQLIEADNHLLAYERGEDRFVSADSGDLNFDGKTEVRLENDHLIAFFAPAHGGTMYELDVRGFNINLGASLTRRPEAYHRLLLAQNSNQTGEFGAIHNRVVLKQEGLDQRLTYDWYPRKSLVDHFYAVDADLESVAAGQVAELGDFVQGKYRSTVSETGDQVMLLLVRQGTAEGHVVGVSKKVTITSGQNGLSVRYRLDLPRGEGKFLFAVELNFGALAANAEDRYFRGAGNEKLATLGSRFARSPVNSIALVDEWIGVQVGLGFSQPAGLWSFPIESVSQSEGGFELVHQSTCVLPYWEISLPNSPEAACTWEVEIALRIANAGEGSLDFRPSEENCYAEENYFTANKTAER